MPRLSITHYALLFALVILVLFGGYGVFTYLELHKSRQIMRGSLVQAAQQELTQAIDRAVEAGAQDMRRFTEWDEVQQQIANPTYYAYWRKHRMLSTALLPDYVEDAEIYDREGNALAKISESTLPPKLGSLERTIYVDNLKGTPSLVYIDAVHDKTTAQVLGYAAIRSQLMPILFKLSHFRYVDTSKLQIAFTQPTLAMSQLTESFRFELTQSPFTDQLSDLMTAAILRMGLIIAVITLLFYPGVIFAVARPLRRLSQHIRELHEHGDIPVRKALSSSFPIAELETIRHSLNSYQAQLTTVHASLDEKNKELWELAHLDALTGVLNRRAFDEHWEHVNEVLRDQRLGVCFVLFDVNHFKAINDTYGHQIGDQVLQGITACINSVLRRSAQLYRLGGDEFATILIDCGREDSVGVAQRCQNAIGAFDFSAFGIREPVRVSIGLAQTSALDTYNLRALHWQADAAMYAAKRPGKSHIAVYDKSMTRESDAILSNWVLNAVYDAVNDDSHIEMHYQPIVDLELGTVAYFEALVRIRYNQELVFPDRIMPVVDNRRLENELDYAVVRAVLRDLEQGLIPANTGVSINISGPTIVQKEVVRWLEHFEPYLDRYRLVLEVTETALITQLQAATDHLRRLQQMGFQIALDDFGSGYSSVRYLASMPVDLVKFDISLIQGLDDDSQLNIVRHLAQMIVEAGHPLVAEGIENTALLNKVRRAGFRYGQGYLFAHPDRSTSLANINTGRGEKDDPTTDVSALPPAVHIHQSHTP